MKFFLLLPVHLFVLTACGHFKGPSGDPAQMSADTLCYRQAYTQANDAYTAEIEVRGLNCTRILEQHTMLPGSRP